MTISTLEQSVIADVKTKIANLSAEAKAEILGVETFGAKYWLAIAVACIAIGVALGAWA